MADDAQLLIPEMGAWLEELAELPASIQRRVLRGAVASGASVMRKQAKVNVSKDTGNLAKAIYQVRLKEECDDNLEVWKVDIARGRRARNDGYYARWVEYGHYTRGIGGARFTKSERKILYSAAITARPVSIMDQVQGAKWVPAKPFMRPAFQSTKEMALKAMSEYLQENLQSALATARYFKVIA